MRITFVHNWRLAFVVTLGLFGDTLAAEPRISAQIDTATEATLTVQEQRAVSIAAGRLLRHAQNAHTALAVEDVEKAAAEIALSELLVQIIEKAVPNAIVNAKIASGDLEYEVEETVKPTIIPIHKELDMVSLTAPLNRARAELASEERDDDASIGVVEHAMRDVEITLDLQLAEAGIRTAKAMLQANDLDAARGGLAAMLHHSLQFTVITLDVPLHRAQENLMLAKTALELGDWDNAKMLLAEVNESLSTYEQGTEKTRQKAVAELRREITSLADALDADKPTVNVVTSIDGWWDRIGEWFR